MISNVTAPAQPSDSAGLGSRPGGLAGLTPSGRAIVPLGWALYDFANTIFSFAVVSGAIGLWLTDDARFGERDGNVLLSVAIVASVGLNAIVSPILGAISDRAGGRRMPVPAVLHRCCASSRRRSSASARRSSACCCSSSRTSPTRRRSSTTTPRSGLVSYPETRGKLSGIGVAIGYCGTIFVGLLIFFLDIPVGERFLVAAAAVRRCSRSRSSSSCVSPAGTVRPVAGRRCRARGPSSS